MRLIGTVSRETSDREWREIKTFSVEVSTDRPKDVADFSLTGEGLYIPHQHIPHLVLETVRQNVTAALHQRMVILEPNAREHTELTSKWHVAFSMTN